MLEDIPTTDPIFSSLVEANPDGVLAFDRECRYTIWNPAMEVISGVSRAAALGRRAFDLFPFLRETGEDEFFRRVLAGETVVARERPYAVPETGRRGLFDAHYTPLRDSSGRVFGGAAIVRDVTARREAEDALRTSEERYRSFIANSSEGIWRFEMGRPVPVDLPVEEQLDLFYESARLAESNDAAARMYGYESAGEIIGASLGDFLVRSDPENVAYLSAFIRSGYRLTDVESVELDREGGRKFFSNSLVGVVEGGRLARVWGTQRDVTERRRAEEALKLYGERYESLLENANDIIYSHDLQGNYLSINRACEQVTGYTRAEILGGLNIAQVVAPEHLERARLMMERKLRDPSPTVYEIDILTRDRRRLTLEVSTRISYRDGAPVAVEGVARDVTERKRAEEERARRETKERFLAEAKNALTASLDYETTLASVARAAVPVFADWCAVDMADEAGTLRRLAVAHHDPAKVEWAREIHGRYPPDPAAPYGLHQVLRTGESEFYPEVTDEILAAGARDEEHLRLMREVGFRSVMLVPLKLRGQVLGVLTFVNSDSGRAHTREDLALAEDLARRASLAIDNARLYRAERETRLAAERTADRLARLQAVSTALSHALTPQEVARAVIEHGVNSMGAHAGTVVAPVEGGAALEMVATFGFPPEVAARWRRFDLSAPVPLADAVREQSHVFIESFADAGARYPMLEALTPVTGSRALLAVALIVEGRTVGGMGLSFREPQKFGGEDRAFILALAQQCAQALERARLYETERRLRAEAEEANRIKDEFLATVSHELRTPLTAILGWSSMLRAGHFDSEERAVALEVIERNARAQARIVDDILEVSRIITGKLRLETREADLGAVVAAALESVRPAAETKGVRLRHEAEAGALAVWGDAARLQQVLWNLLSNAVKFTPAGGDVRVRLGRAGERARIVVSDTGQGIEPEFLPFVFDRFRQADGKSTRAHGGLGLGLAIVRHLVELHGGTVKAESGGAGGGATFTVELPVAAARGGEAGARPQPLEPDSAADETPAGDLSRSLAGVRVLVVDDERDARELVAAAVGRRGAEVLAVGSAAEALDAVAAFRPDVLVSDIGMPHEDGYSLIRRVRALGADEGGRVAAVALTAYAREEDRARALSAGYQVHVAKPVNPSELAGVVGELAEKKR